MARYTPEQREQVLTLWSTDESITARKIADITGVGYATVKRWLSGSTNQPAGAATFADKLAARLETLQSPADKLEQIRDEFTSRQCELLLRHTRDLEVLRGRSLKAVLDNDNETVRALAALLTATIKGQQHERELYGLSELPKNILRRNM